MATPETVSRMYEQFAAPERATLVLEAMARGDEAEMTRLQTSCPKITYRQSDADYSDRLDLAFDTLAVVCIDFRGLWHKLRTLDGLDADLERVVGLHCLNAVFAFMDGVDYARGLSQSPFYASRTAPGAGAEPADEAEAPDGPDEPDDAGDEDDGGPAPGAVETFSGMAARHPDEPEFGRRLAAVSIVSDQATARVRAMLREVAGYVAHDLVDCWEAYARFCRKRLGVTPETMLAAWEFPVAGDLKAMLAKYAHLKPREGQVVQLVACIDAAWGRRFGPAEGGEA